MKVYELIQELTRFEPDTEVYFDLNGYFNPENYEIYSDRNYRNIKEVLDYDSIQSKKYITGEECHINLSY